MIRSINQGKAQENHWFAKFNMLW